jgi:hypothetical protein
MPEYRGTHYQIVRAANPTGYRWTAYIDGNRTRNGFCYTMESAIFEVKSKIAQFVKPAWKTASIVPDPGPICAFPKDDLSDPD